MNDNNLNNNDLDHNDFQNDSGVYRASSNLNTAIENPQMNLDNVNSVNIKGLGYNNYANDDNVDTDFLDNNVDNDIDLAADSTVSNEDNYVYENPQQDSNNYSYEPVMKQKKRKGDNPISNLLHSSEFKAMIFIVFILVLFLLMMPYIYDFIRNLQLQMTA